MKLKAVCCRMTMFFEKLRSGTAYEKNTGRLKLLYRFFGEDAVFYINGSQVLPSPLDAENEAKALAALKSEDRLAAERRKICLSNEICVWWCTLPNASKTRASGLRI